MKALKDRGISAGIARQLLAESVLDAGLIRDQVEWGDLVLSQSTPRKWRNPPGFYVWLIRERILPPDTFESSRKRKLRQQAESEQAELQFDTDDLEIGYEQYRRRVVDEYQSSLDPKFLADARLKAEWKVSRQYPTLPKATLKQMALCAVQADLAAQIGVLSFEEFRRQRAGAPKDEAGWEVQS